MRMKRHRDKGTAAAELPILLWILFVVILIPISNLSAICLRRYFVYQACHNAALVGAKARSFQTDFPPDISAKNSANATATAIIAGYNGITLNSVRTEMVITTLAGNVETLRTAPLTTPPDTTNNLYSIRVTLDCNVDPVIAFNLGSFLSGIPGLTGPVNVTVNDQNICENVAGLTR